MTRRRRILEVGRCALHPSRFRVACPGCFAIATDDGSFALRRRVIASARTFIGAPFQHHGRGAGGIDCSGLNVAAFRIAGAAVDDFTGYDRGICGEELLAWLRKTADELDDVDGALPGDVAVFRTGRHVQHLALLSDDGGIIHADAVLGRVLEHVLDDVWRDRLALVVRPRSLRVGKPG